ncbi:hypothetical protein RvY_14385 [Ramazzottius varieornatus]|uniref:Uncharacterized protein n=1 Tax=Ramazzottius varieornatus TaxID=947166 RepID=A0A1D1VR55_RAMVA|nr:hypothetical protein RvY_14385 [Ramazzottius varieornatus]
MSFSFGATAFGSQPATQTALPAFGSSFGGFGQPAGTSLFGGLSNTSIGTKPSTGSTGFGGFSMTAATTAPSFNFPSTTTTNAAPSSQPSVFGISTTTPSSTYHFPTKPSEQPGTSSSGSNAQQTVTPAKAGSTGSRPKDQIIPEQLGSDIFDLEKQIKKYQKIQEDASEYSLADAVAWSSQMDGFDVSATKVRNQLSETFNVIDLLRRNTARLRSHNLLFNRLASNPNAYYSVASSVEAYFMEVLSGIRTELEIFEEELQHLEDLHQDLLRPSDRFSTLDVHGAYMSLSKIVNGVAVAVDQVGKVGEELRRESQALKGGATPIPAPHQPVLVQDATQLSSARSLFSTQLGSGTPSSSIFQHHYPSASKSPLLQPMSPDLQSSMFNPAMRSLTRMDSSSGMSPTGNSSSPMSSRMHQPHFLNVTSPGF